MFCSTVIPTVGRSSLSHAVASVLDQGAAADIFEIIVVNDTGQPLASAGWHNHPNVRIVTTNRRERSFARNTGAALACGEFLHFMDDDDWMAPGALAAFRRLAQSSAASWLYGTACLLDERHQLRHELLLAEQGNCFAHILGGEWIPLQASLIKARTFFEIGGFNPLSTPGEDRDLCNRYALVGEFSFTRELVAYLDRSSESTTNYELSLRHSRREREKLFNERGVVGRLRASSDAPYWRGRATRVLMASAAANLRARRPLLSLSRAFAAARCVSDCPTLFFRHSFWNGLANSHTSRIVSTTGTTGVMEGHSS
jgi:glycosyltransferase involved in cell wall biosynthesis